MLLLQTPTPSPASSARKIPSVSSMNIFDSITRFQPLISFDPVVAHQHEAGLNLAFEFTSACEASILRSEARLAHFEREHCATLPPRTAAFSCAMLIAHAVLPIVQAAPR